MDTNFKVATAPAATSPAQPRWAVVSDTHYYCEKEDELIAKEDVKRSEIPEWIERGLYYNSHRAAEIALNKLNQG